MSVECLQLECTTMFAYALATGARFSAVLYPPLLIHFTASTYFYLPVDEEEDRVIQNYQRKYLTWVAESSPHHARDDSVVNIVVSNDDLYKILGLSRQPTLDKISLRRAYLSRSKACHPEQVF